VILYREMCTEITEDHASFGVGDGGSICLWNICTLHQSVWHICVLISDSWHFYTY